MMGSELGFDDDYLVQQAPEGFAIVQGGRSMDTPGGAPMVVPTREIAESIAHEAKLRAARKDNGKSPFTQLATTAIDIISHSRDEIVTEIMGYAESELLCHRAGEPRKLVKEQTRTWQPLLDWCAKRFKAPLNTTVGVMPVEQPPESLANLRRSIEGCNNFLLVGIMQAVSASGSLVLGLALAARQVTPQQALEAAELDGNHQEDEWGQDVDARVRREAIRQELSVCGLWFDALKNRNAT